MTCASKMRRGLWCAFHCGIALTTEGRDSFNCGPKPDFTTRQSLNSPASLGQICPHHQEEAFHPGHFIHLVYPLSRGQASHRR